MSDVPVILPADTLVPVLVPEPERVPDPEPEQLPSGEVLVSGAGLRSSTFSFGFLDGFLLKGAVCGPQTRAAWTAAGEQAAA
jgi:hypothetical protein